MHTERKLPTKNVVHAAANITLLFQIKQFNSSPYSKPGRNFKDAYLCSKITLVN